MGSSAVMAFGFGCGRSTWILCASTGAVIMKMISSTSITSTSGVTLISDIGPLVLVVKAISGHPFGASVVMKPTCTMPESLASPMIFFTILNSVFLSARICSSGWGDFCAFTANCARNSASVTR